MADNVGFSTSGRSYSIRQRSAKGARDTDTAFGEIICFHAEDGLFRSTGLGLFCRA